MKMHYYNFNNNLLISQDTYNFDEISENFAQKFKGTIYALTKMDPAKSRRSFCISSPSMLFLESEDVNLIFKKNTKLEIPGWLRLAIDEKRVMSVNTNYPEWQFNMTSREKYLKATVSIAGMGDVGGILCTGLRLIGGDCISKIKIFDKNPDRIRRWELECNSILSSCDIRYPDVIGTSEENIFDCDLFVFCISKGVPEIGQENSDVRLAQLEGNMNIIKYYARLARERNFKGYFAVVSDPVDILCKAVFEESNKDEYGIVDFKGLAPEQIKGFGLGVMYARAAYYSKDLNMHEKFLAEGRAFGPHGNGLVIANSISNYDKKVSEYLTRKARESNLEVRATGFKPYIAPALSSGSLSLTALLKGDWHYSANFLGGVYFGCRNRELESGTEIETYSMPDALYKDICKTYGSLFNYSSQGGI